MASSFQEEKQKRALSILKRKEEEESIKILSEKYKLPYLDLSIFPVELDAIRVIPEAEARRAEMAGFQSVGNNLSVALRNPDKPETKAVLERLLRENWKCKAYLVSKYGLERAWEFYKKIPLVRAAEAGAIQIHDERLNALEKEIRGLDDIALALKESNLSKTTESLEVVLAGAITLDASDVHIEPQEKKVELRLRLDGVLHEVAEISQKLYPLLLSRIKLISELKLNVHDRAQDGRFTIHTKNIDIEVRTSTLPGPYGENVVLRILNPKNLEVAFDDLGMQPWVRSAVEIELKKPNGMIITTGPTGSGKTTTLYSALNEIKSDKIKIITTEDPVEYRLPGINQIQVHTKVGLTFAASLRSILRHDPDVVLVGEIRDQETAINAIQASLTGHLVFSTLHTNDSSGAFVRLIDMGIEPFLVASTVEGVMAQRLVRTLCEECRVPYEPQAGELPDDFPLDALREAQMPLFRAIGCRRCRSTGYSGRVGLYELLLANDEIRHLASERVSTQEIKQAAVRAGLRTLRQDGWRCVLEGKTTIEEVIRVAKSD